MIDTEPTTLPGLTALFACLRDNKMAREQIGESYNYIDKFVATLSAATAKFSA